MKKARLSLYLIQAMLACSQETFQISTAFDDVKVDQKKKGILWQPKQRTFPYSMLIKTVRKEKFTSTTKARIRLPQ